MGRGRGGGRGGEAMPREVVVSKRLSKLLRHGGLKLGKGGYVNLAELLVKQDFDIFTKLADRNIQSLSPRTTLSEIKSLVASNDKQRFSLIHINALNSIADTPPNGSSATVASETAEPIDDSKTEDAHEDDMEPSHYLIRANQGHSVKVEIDDLLTPITVASGNLPTTVVHGTRLEHWSKILASGGLKPMGRNHVHFAIGIPESLKLAATKENDVVNEDDVAALPEKREPRVLSGMRNSSTILIFINLKLALEYGVKFWLSENNVVLSEGDENGLVGLQFFERVEERGGRVLVKDGAVVAEAELSDRGHGSSRGGGRGRGGQGRARGEGRPLRGVIPRDI